MTDEPTPPRDTVTLGIDPADPHGRIEVTYIGQRDYATTPPNPVLRRIVDDAIARWGRQASERQDEEMTDWSELRRGDSEPSAFRVPTPATPVPPGFAALYVTFGGKYAREPHETGLPWPHPDGFLTVHYRDVEELEATYVPTFPGHANTARSAAERARQTVMAYLGGHFATSYTDEPTEYVPWGQLALLVLP